MSVHHVRLRCPSRALPPSPSWQSTKRRRPCQNERCTWPRWGPSTHCSGGGIAVMRRRQMELLRGSWASGIVRFPFFSQLVLNNLLTIWWYWLMRSVWESRVWISGFYGGGGSVSRYNRWRKIVVNRVLRGVNPVWRKRKAVRLCV